MLYVTCEDEIRLSDNIQAIYFFASWMPYHKKMITMVSKIEEKLPIVSFLAIDVDQFSNQCKRFAVESIPTVIVFKDGREVKRINGMVLTSAFRSAFVDICTPEVLKRRNS